VLRARLHGLASARAGPAGVANWLQSSGGLCFLFTALFYEILDVRQKRAWSFPLLVRGMNSIAACRGVLENRSSRPRYDLSHVPLPDPRPGIRGHPARSRLFGVDLAGVVADAPPQGLVSL
jgi:hypothetical protein